MKRQLSVNFALVSVIVLTGQISHGEIRGQSIEFRSSRNISERCTVLDSVPSGVYSNKDREKEAALCALDVRAPSIALCPKTWSTSAGTMLYSTEASGLTPAEYEAQNCGRKSGHKKLAKFKTSMGEPDTSDTYSTASMLYYHLSRYFDSHIEVPVAVYRTLDRVEHLDRVTRLARGKGARNRAAWAHLLRYETDPSTSRSPLRLFTEDRESIHGVLMKDSGEEYGPELNGPMTTAWGDGWSEEFMQSPAFIALRSTLPIDQAVDEGMRIGMAHPKIATAFGRAVVPRSQMVSWMKDLTEITLLDFILSQQDRIPNIDFNWTWHYAKDGKIETKKEKEKEDLPLRSREQIRPPAEIAAYNPVLLMRTAINDNDAGGRVEYSNYTKRARMLESIRHYSPDTYRKLIGLNSDFQSRGALYQYFASTFNLSERELAQLVRNTQLATGILQATCRAQQEKMRFDINPEASLLGQPSSESSVNCDQP